MGQCFCPLPALAQTSPPPGDKAPPIQDNSFLIEEAYNQEDGVVQHINTFQRQKNGDWVYTFTQEWPIGGLAHQFSYTIPLRRADSNIGFGDLALNYRYQLMGDGDSALAVSPRVSLLLPGTICRSLARL